MRNLLCVVLVACAACSDPNGYKGGGRLLTLPGSDGGSGLVGAAADASVGAGGGPGPVEDAGSND